MSETPPPQAYISKVHLKGYKSIKDLEIDFKPGLNIIIGPNGSGKTNFLEFIEEANDSMYYDDLTNEEFDFKLTKSDGSEFYLDGRFSLYENQYVFKMNEKNIENGKNVFERVFIHQGKKGDVSITNVKINDEPSKYPEKYNCLGSFCFNQSKTAEHHCRHKHQTNYFFHCIFSSKLLCY